MKLSFAFRIFKPTYKIYFPSEDNHIYTMNESQDRLREAIQKLKARKMSGSAIIEIIDLVYVVLESGKPTFLQVIKEIYEEDKKSIEEIDPSTSAEVSVSSTSVEVSGRKLGIKKLKLPPQPASVEKLNAVELLDSKYNGINNLPIVTKRCIDCGRTLPLSQFSKNANTSDGYSYYCKDDAKRRQKASTDKTTMIFLKDLVRLTDHGFPIKEPVKGESWTVGAITGRLGGHSKRTKMLLGKLFSAGYIDRKFSDKENEYIYWLTLEGNEIGKRYVPES